MWGMGNRRIVRAISLTAALGTLGASAIAGTAAAQVDAPGLKVGVYSSGFTPHPKGPGAMGLVWLADNRLLAASPPEAAIFSIPAGGGTRERLAEWPANAAPTGMAIANGRVYATIINQGSIVEIDPRTGRILRTVVTGLRCPAALAITADGEELFVSAIHCAPGIKRIRNIHGQGAPVVTDYGQVGYVNGLAIAPDGDLWAADGSKEVLRIAGPASPLAGAIHNRFAVDGADGMVVTPPRGDLPSYVWASSVKGTLTRIDPARPGDAPVVAVRGLARGDQIIEDTAGCLYIGQPRNIIRVSLPDNGCPVALPRSGGASLLPRTCSSRRVVSIKVRRWRGQRIRSARVYLDGEPVRVYRFGGRVRAEVDLRGKPKGRYVVRIDASLRDGTTVTGSRVYLTCTRKQPRNPPVL